MTPKRNDLQALRNMIAESRDILATTILPEGRAERAHELLEAAVSLADNLLSISPAASLGKRGGKVTAKRGPDYFRKIAAMRKRKRGGRPSKILVTTSTTPCMPTLNTTKYLANKANGNSNI